MVFGKPGWELNIFTIICYKVSYSAFKVVNRQFNSLQIPAGLATYFLCFSLMFYIVFDLGLQTF